MKQDIVQIPDEVLRTPSKKVENFDDPALHILIQNMKDTLAKSKNGIGLAAPQIGSSMRVFITNIKEFQGVFINPTITRYSKKEVMLEEGCLSVDGHFEKIWRSANVTFKAYDEKGNKVKHKVSGLAAQLVQHETDHLNGIVFVDRIKEQKKEGLL